MVATKLTGLSAFTPILTDIVYGVDDPGGTPISGKLTLTAIRDLLQANLTGATITGATLTGAAGDSLVSMTQTWNTTGTPTAVKLNITDTASNSSSRLLDLQIGGTSVAYLRKDGRFWFQSIETTGTSSESAIKGSCSFPTADMFVDRISKSFKLGATSAIAWTNGAYFSTSDVIIQRDAAGVLAQRNGTNAQAFRLYNTYTDASNYERGALRWNSNVLELGSFAAGTGVLRGLRLGVSGNSLGFLGATPIAQYSTTGTTTGFTAGAGTAVNDDSTFTGNTGATAYTIGDVVRALKQYGLIAS